MERKITIKRSNRKTLSLKINEAGEVIVYAPLLLPKTLINQFIKKHEAWINKHLQRINQRNIAFTQKQFIDGEEFLYIGNKYQLITTYTTPKNLIIFNQKNFLLNPEVKDPLTLFKSWYKEQAQTIFQEQVQYHSKLMNLIPTDIKLSNAKTRWGSCNTKNLIRLNWKLIMAPLSIINYVIIHELAHINQKNHSKTFWEIVQNFDPEYKQHRKWLKENGYLLDLQSKNN